ncbi:sensor histidine kinase [Aliidiomarina sp.]|uniref:sensor histidine kinase n=1 Tax=Aliidiomarina sp. TaxID=1872439 RepID=UPI003A4E20FF
MPERRTRWYQSLTFRLLTIFWSLILLTAMAAFSAVLYLSAPPGPTELSEDYQRAIEPILNHPSTEGMIQPGRLLVGQYRVVAVNSLELNEIIYVPGMSQFQVGVAFDIMQSAEPVQAVVGEHTYGGPFASSEGDVVIARPASSEELAMLAENGDQDWWPRLILIAIAASFLGALILGWWFVRPLRQLRNATREIAAGSAEPNLARLPKRKDELGELARTMATTAVQLANSRDAQRRLLSDISHELRSPVGRLQVALDLMETDELRKNRNYLQLHKDIYRLGSIIDSILWLSRLENGLEKLVKDPVDIAAVLKDLQSDLYYLQYDKNQPSWEGRLQLPARKLPELEADAVLLRLIIENLVRNGFQYGPENGQVRVSAAVKGNEISLTVRDEGPGVPQEKLKKMFEPFFRADPSRHHGAGVGLGLALCQRAVLVLGGSIHAENHPEGGLAVTVRLPLS